MYREKKKGGNEMKNILLACGSGASSGFIAQKMRKAAKERKLGISIKAVSDTEILEHIDGVGVLMVGPHLKHRMAEIEESVKEFGVKAAIIDQRCYAMLDGETVLKQALKLME